MSGHNEPDVIKSMPPRTVRIARWWPISCLAMVSAFMMPHTIIGLCLAYVAVEVTILRLTGLSLPSLRAGGDLPSLSIVWATAVFWNGLLIVAWSAIWLRVCTEYNLLAWGTVTVGNVVGKRTVSTGTIAHGIGYEIDFAYPIETGLMKVDEACFNKLSVGDPVTVLYDPLSPKRAIIYEGCVVFSVRQIETHSVAAIS